MGEACWVPLRLVMSRRWMPSDFVHNLTNISARYIYLRISLDSLSSDDWKDVKKLDARIAPTRQIFG